MTGPEGTPRPLAAPELAAEIVDDPAARPPRMGSRRLHTRIERDFTYHPPSIPRQLQVYAEFRKRCRDLGHYMVDYIPEGRELSRALSDLEDVSMHGNSGIARNPEAYSD